METQRETARKKMIWLVQTSIRNKWAQSGLQIQLSKNRVIIGGSWVPQSWWWHHQHWQEINKMHSRGTSPTVRCIGAAPMWCFLTDTHMQQHGPAPCSRRAMHYSTWQQQRQQTSTSLISQPSWHSDTKSCSCIDFWCACVRVWWHEGAVKRQSESQWTRNASPWLHTACLNLLISNKCPPMWPWSWFIVQKHFAALAWGWFNASSWMFLWQGRDGWFASMQTRQHNTNLTAGATGHFHTFPLQSKAYKWVCWGACHTPHASHFAPRVWLSAPTCAVILSCDRQASEVV